MGSNHSKNEEYDENTVDKADAQGGNPVETVEQLKEENERLKGEIKNLRRQCSFLMGVYDKYRTLIKNTLGGKGETQVSNAQIVLAAESIASDLNQQLDSRSANRQFSQTPRTNARFH